MSRSALTLVPDTDLDGCAQGIHSHSRRALREMLHAGRFLLIARSLHALPPEARNQGRKSLPTVGSDSSDAFLTWLRAQDFEFNQASAYNYMTACERLEISAASTAEDVEALDLEGKTLRSLIGKQNSAPVIGEGTPDPEPPVSPRDAAKALWTPLIGELAEAFAPESAQRKALHLLPPAALKDVKTKLLTALDVLNSILKN